LFSEYREIQDSKRRKTAFSLIPKVANRPGDHKGLAAILMNSGFAPFILCLNIFRSK
jgi:hypothetical protein